MKGIGTTEVKPRLTANAVARLEMAKEKARMMGKKPTAISELEQAAEKWKEGKELKQAQLSYPTRDDSPVTITSVPLRVIDKSHRKDDEIIWTQHRLHPEEGPRQIKMNAVMINAIAQHLKARGWARAMGKTRRQLNNGNDLEKAAEQWKRQKELEQRGSPEMEQRSISR